MHSRRAIAVPVVLATVLLLLAIFLAGSSAPVPAVRSFEFTYLTRIPSMPADGQQLRLWIPLPRNDPNQTISRLKIESSIPYARHREPEYGNEYIYLEAKPAQLKQPLEVRLRFNVLRREHRVTTGSANSADPLSPRDKALLERFRQPDHLVPTDGLIAQLAEQQTQGLNTPLQKARAIYDYVIATLRYDKSGEGWGRGDAIWACTSKHGNCTDFHSLLIGMLRSEGIPARFEIGFPLPSDKKEGTISGYHCWAEFYLEPTGWIPVDSSEAWKNPAMRDYFFGAHDEHRVLFTLGRDIHLNPAQEGEPLNYFIYPYAELDGKPFKGVEYQFAFRDVPSKTR